MISLLKKVHLFSGLSESELEQIESVCHSREYSRSELVVEQNTTGNEVYFVGRGSIEVFVSGLENERTLVVLGEGQVFGETALLGQGYRSASGRAGQEGCTLYVLDSKAFNDLCASNTRIGYIVMRNLSLDLSFKLRHRNLAGM